MLDRPRDEPVPEPGGDARDEQLARAELLAVGPPGAAAHVARRKDALAVLEHAELDGHADADAEQRRERALRARTRQLELRGRRAAEEKRWRTL